jgi:hypothetical protein
MNTLRIMRGIAIATLLCCAHAARPQDVAQKTFPAAEDAVVALVEAAAGGNEANLHAIFGPGADKILSSGDPVMDLRNREVFLVAYAEDASLMKVSPTRSVLYIGNEGWPFPVPLQKQGAAWRFDTPAGVQEILIRRIGRNELSTIDVCQVYVAAQQEYALGAHGAQSAGAYAQRIASSPGKHDGLYWHSDEDDKQSPLGEFAAEAAAEGYHHTDDHASPFHGYLFRILTGEGPKGGGHSYIVNGQMRNGFALLAYPAAYGVSGVMSFIVNQDGVVYQSDLGPNTAAVAADITSYDPTSAWSKVD